MGKDLCTQGSRIGFWRGKGEAKKFNPLTNFSMKFVKFIKAPEKLPNFAGFMVKVTQIIGSNTIEGLVQIISSSFVFQLSLFKFAVHAFCLGTM